MLAAVLAGWAADTKFADPVRLMHDRKDAAREHRQLAGGPAVASAGLIVSTEFLGECAKLRGAAAAVVGFTPRHEPRIAGVVLLGESTTAAFAVRSFLANSADLRRIAEIDGVPVFQRKPFPQPNYGPDGKPMPFENPKPAAAENTATFAYRPGLFVVGTDVPAVADVLKRFAGKPPSPGLSSAAGFPKSSREKPGLVLFALPPALMSECEAARKIDMDVIDRDILAVLNFVANAKAVPVLTGTLTFAADELTLDVSAAGGAGPIPGLLAGAGGDAVPAAGDGVARLSFPAGPGRAAVILAAADAWAKAAGELGPLPTDMLADAAKALNADLAADFLGKVASASLLVPDGPPVTTFRPAIRLGFDDDAAAGRFETRFPKLVAVAAGLPAVPTVFAETIDGVKVSVAAGGGLADPVHFARVGPAVVFGPDRKWVAKFANLAAKPGDPAPLTTTIRPTAFTRRAGVPEWLSAADPLPPVEIRVTLKDGLRVRAATTGFRRLLPAAIDKLVPWIERAGAIEGGGTFLPRISVFN